MTADDASVSAVSDWVRREMQMAAVSLLGSAASLLFTVGNATERSARGFAASTGDFLAFGDAWVSSSLCDFPIS